MSRRLTAGPGALILFLALAFAFAPASAFAAGTHNRAATSATHSLRADATAVLVPGTGYALPSGSVQVRSLQKKLDRSGFASGPLDGRYGPLTTEAVRRFQQAHGLAVDGLAGPRTFAAFKTVVLAPGTGYGLHSGSEQVKALQHNLARAGISSGPADGLYGPRTTEAVRRFQHARGLAVTGVAGPLTLATLQGYLTRPTGSGLPVGTWHKPSHYAPTPNRLVPLPAPGVPPKLPIGQHFVVPNLRIPQFVGAAVVILGLLVAFLAYRTERQRTRPGGRPTSGRPPTPRSLLHPTRLGHQGGRRR